MILNRGISDITNCCAGLLEHVQGLFKLSICRKIWNLSRMLINETRRAPPTENRTLCVVLSVFLVVMGVFGEPGRAEAARNASIVIDGNTGKVLQSSRPDRLVYPASLTKMMTLFLVFDEIERGHLSFKTRIKVSAKAAKVQPSKLGLKAGETITVKNAIKALITKSANDIAIALGEHIARSERAFARRMTARARQLGMTKTVFKNASGLPNSDQVTTARDMARLGLALRNVHAKYYHLFALRSFTYKGRRYPNHNGLLKNYPGTDGLKTGYTRASGFNLVASVKRGSKHLIGAVFGGKSAGKRNRRMRALLSAAFKNASPVKSRKFRRQQQDLIARVKIRRAPAPRLAKRPRRAPIRVARRRPAPKRLAAKPAVRRTTANASLAKRVVAPPIKIARARTVNSFAPATKTRSINPPIRLTRVRPVKFARLQPRLPAPQPATRSPVINDTASGVTTMYRTPARLPRQAVRVAAVAAPPQFRLLRQPVAARQPSTFQQQAALLAATDRLQYAPTNTLRTALFRPSFPSPRPAQARRAGTSGVIPSVGITKPQDTSGRSAPIAGDYQVQIGAYGTLREAERRIAVVRANAGSILAGFGTLTIPFDKENRRYYRARFSGFDNRTASATCKQLKLRKVDCFVAKSSR